MNFFKRLTALVKPFSTVGIGWKLLYACFQYFQPISMVVNVPRLADDFIYCLLISADTFRTCAKK
ncbi:MAG: hypothetical protein SO471_17755, partial [Anaerobutyricum hallii]|nr:hypothetical protein [Anaerobutyricum hallii]